jgi:hypothetical protein
VKEQIEIERVRRKEQYKDDLKILENTIAIGDLEEGNIDDAKIWGSEIYM